MNIVAVSLVAVYIYIYIYIVSSLENKTSILLYALLELHAKVG